ncbi:MAG TPA: MSMEG_0568 family radical SAM protein [Polyangiaceae bacterium]|nr:MSMEG_0568 family radical SAM protein [Polyangiaceae bacterium]
MNRPLPLLPAPSPPPKPFELIAELQAFGVRWIDPSGPGLSRTGGAGPSDHKAVRVANQTVMIPIFTHAAAHSPYSARVAPSGLAATLQRDGVPIAEVTFPPMPAFYARCTAEGIPYWKIARLHADDVLATTVLQTCVRYGRRETCCQFCAIGQSLASRGTIAEKRPDQLAEVAEAAVALDGVKHVVLTTGTPHTEDRGARVLGDAARAIKARVAVPIQAQCEPPADLAWLDRMAAAGVDSLGMHLEAVTEAVRRRIMPGKAEVPVTTYFEAFERAVRVFGRGQVSTYILAGLGDTREAILGVCRELVALGVYPFVVPFVPIAGTPLEDHPGPSPVFLRSVIDDVARLLSQAGMRSDDIKAGCGRCGACSSLRAREVFDA